jgi:hypothetical protein
MPGTGTLHRSSASGPVGGVSEQIIGAGSPALHLIFRLQYRKNFETKSLEGICNQYENEKYESDLDSVNGGIWSSGRRTGTARRASGEKR